MTGSHGEWLHEEGGSNASSAAAASILPAPLMAEYPPITGRGMAVLLVSLLLPLFATLWTGLRIWTRRLRGLSPFLLEDILCYIGLLIFWGVGINYICMVFLGGGGHHLVELQPITLARFSKTTFASQVLYAGALGFTKNSIVYMIKRIFFTQSYAWIAYTVMALNVAWMLQTILTGVLICHPISLNWDPSARGHCGNQTYAFAAISIVDIITDLSIIILPLRMVMGLHMKLTYRIALGCVFGCGLVTVVFTAIRLYFVFGLDFQDISYASVPLVVIGVVQLCVANIVASAPLLRPVFDRTVGRWFSLSVVSVTDNTPQNNGSGVAGQKSGISSAGGGMRNGLHSRSRLTGGGSKSFKRISESEENLRWELDVIHCDKGKTSTFVTRPNLKDDSSADAETAPMGHIMVTQSTEVSRQ